MFANVFVPNHLRGKMDKKVVRCIVVGYDNQRKGWRCCDPTSEKCCMSRMWRSIKHLHDGTQIRRHCQSLLVSKVVYNLLKFGLSVRETEIESVTDNP